jgi:hypothetical protein
MLQHVICNISHNIIDSDNEQQRQKVVWQHADSFIHHVSLAIHGDVLHMWCNLLSPRLELFSVYVMAVCVCVCECTALSRICYSGPY